MANMELLAPVGSFGAFINAINNGADALYLSGKKYGARATTSTNPNFTNEEIKEMIELAHLYKVKVYVTVNTLIKDDEMNECLEYINFLYLNHVDAILIQDIGLAMILSQIMPSLNLHASTQMNVHSVEDAKRLHDLGFKRIVLGRECSLELVKKIKDEVDIEIEVFAHGALCMSYSGNCYLSSLIGKQSGNRGRCKGACRLPYELLKASDEHAIIDNNISKKLESVGESKYYLSLKDLYTLDSIEELKKAKVDSIKIEGRLKGEEYVGLITKSYKDALLGIVSLTDARYKIEEMFNRSFTKGYLLGDDNNNMTNITSPNHIGVSVGHIVKAYKDSAVLYLDTLSEKDKIEYNDSLRIVSTDSDLEDAVTISAMDKVVKIKKGNDLIYKTVGRIKDAKRGEYVLLYTHKRLKEGMLVLKTKTNSLISEFKAKDRIIKKVPIKMFIGNVNDKLYLSYECDGIKVRGESGVLEKAINNMDERIILQATKINDTPFEVKEIDSKLDGYFIAIKEINDIKRSLIDELEKKIVNEYSACDKAKFKRKNLNSDEKEFGFICKVRTIDQYNACSKFEDVKIISEDKDLASKYDNITYIHPRLDDMENVSDDKEYVSVYANVMNAYSMYYFAREGYDKIGLSIELSFGEIKKLISNYESLFKTKANAMMMVYGFYEAMIMKHCLINKLYGYKAKNCLECMRHQYYLKDKKDYCFPLIRDNNCNLKLLNSVRLNLIKYLDEIREIGVNNILLDFTIEDYDETYNVISNYKYAIEGNEYTSSMQLQTMGHFKEGIE